MSKLVRDRIPEIIEKAGKTPVYHRAASQDIEKLLREKLVEEVNELLATTTSEDLLEEAADVYEVLTAIIFTRGYDLKSLLVKAEDKRFDRGAFIKCYVLDEVKDNDRH